MFGAGESEAEEDRSRLNDVGAADLREGMVDRRCKRRRPGEVNAVEAMLEVKYLHGIGGSETTQKCGEDHRRLSSWIVRIYPIVTFHRLHL